MLPYGARGTPLQELLPFHEDQLIAFPCVRPRHLVQHQSRGSATERLERHSTTASNLKDATYSMGALILLGQTPLMAFGFKEIAEPNFSWVRKLGAEFLQDSAKGPGLLEVMDSQGVAESLEDSKPAEDILDGPEESSDGELGCFAECLHDSNQLRNTWPRLKPELRITVAFG